LAFFAEKKATPLISLVYLTSQNYTSRRLRVAALTTHVGRIVMPGGPEYNRSLRRKAEELLSDAPEKLAGMSGRDLQELVHELSVHRIELEMQNEELRRSQEQLEESRSEYADLYDLAPVGYLTFDKMGLVTRVNLTACGLLGIERSLLVRKPFALFTHPESRDLFYVHKQKTLEAMTTETCQLVLKRKDGTFFDAQLESIAVQLNGQPAANSVLTDITEHKRAEQEREQLESQLREAQKFEALGTLAGGIAHEFNNILAAIIGFTELIRDHVPKGSREERHAARVLQAGIRGRELVKQMLTFSQRTKEEEKPLQLSSIVKETVKLLRPSTPSTISIRASMKSESGLILANPVQIRQVLMNLAANAAYAMRERGGVLDMEVSDFSVEPCERNPHGIEPGVYVKLVVRDTGIGMPQEVMEGAFDPFFTTKGLGKGTGLGLSVVLGIVKQAHGYITVDSAPGKGSTFAIYFPKAAEGPATEPATGYALPTGSERILFVDDEEALVQLGEELLAELGYEVVCLMSSLEAFSLIKDDPSRFDLVITDQTMPEMTGFDLTREILALRPDMPVILATGFSPLIDEGSAREAGIKALVAKPLTKRDLAKIIRQALEG
jgi:PAS domain S-box-containing protein